MNNHLTLKFGAISLLTALASVATIGQSIARADIPGAHPYYLHARSDLRKAESILQLPDERNVKQEEAIAAREVYAAIREIDRASVLDRKDVDDHPAIDISLAHQGKFQELERLLQSAKRDISREEDNRSAIAWRQRSITHINEAERHVALAAKRDHTDDWRQRH